MTHIQASGPVRVGRHFGQRRSVEREPCVLIPLKYNNTGTSATL